MRAARTAARSGSRTCRPAPAGAQGARRRVRAWMRPMRWLSFSRSRNAPAVSVASAFTCASAPARLTARRPPCTPAAQTRGGVVERAQRRAHARAAAEAGARMRGRRGAPGAAGLRSRAPPRCCRRRRAAARPRTSAPAPAPARAARGSAGRLRAARGRAAAERSRPPQTLRPCRRAAKRSGTAGHQRAGDRRVALGRSQPGAPMLSTASRPSGRRECRSIRSSVPTAARPPSEFIQHCARARVAAPLREHCALGFRAPRRTPCRTGASRRTACRTVSSPPPGPPRPPAAC